MKKSTIITIIAFVLGIVILTVGFILLTDNNISKGLKETTTAPGAITTTPKPTTTTKPRPTDEPMDFSKGDISQFIELGDYKNLLVELDHTEVTDEEIMQEIVILLCQVNEYTKKWEEGQVITDGVFFSFDYTGYLTKEDGTKDKTFSGSSGTDQLAMIDGNNLITISSTGVSVFIDGFAQKILNSKVGDTFSINITFPDNYSAEMAGKKTIFDIKINYIVVGDFTDAWVKAYTKGDQKTCDEYKEFVKEKLNEYLEKEHLAAIWEKVVENSAVEIPKQQFDYIYNNLRYECETYAPMYQMTYDQFLENGGAYYFFGLKAYSDEELKKTINDSIKYDIVLYSIAKAEGIEVTEEEYQFFIGELIAGTSKTEADIIKEYGSKDDIIKKLLQTEVDAFLFQNNEIVKAEVEE